MEVQNQTKKKVMFILLPRNVIGMSESFRKVCVLLWGTPKLENMPLAIGC